MASFSSFPSPSSKINERLSLLESILGIDDDSNYSNHDGSTRSNDTPVITVRSSYQTSGSYIDEVDISSRVTGLLDSVTARLRQPSENAQSRSINSTSSMSSVEETLSECEALAKTLEASGYRWLLSAYMNIDDSHSDSDNNSTPLIYRKQEVLARSDDLQRGMSQLAKIRDLLSISNQNLIQALQQTTGSTSSKSTISTEQQLAAICKHVDHAPILVHPSFHFASDIVNREQLTQLTSRIMHLIDKTHHLSIKCDHLIHVYSKLIRTVNQKFILYQESKDLRHQES